MAAITYPRAVPARALKAIWTRVSLVALMVATFALYVYGLDHNGWANAYYAAALQAGARSWKLSSSARWTRPTSSPWFVLVYGLFGRPRLFLGEFGGQISWLILTALILMSGGLWITWRAQRTDLRDGQRTRHERSYVEQGQIHYFIGAGCAAKVQETQSKRGSASISPPRLSMV